MVTVSMSSSRSFSRCTQRSLYATSACSTASEKFFFFVPSENRRFSSPLSQPTEQA